VIARRVKEKFRVWLKKREIQLIDDLYETHQNLHILYNNVKDIKLYKPVDNVTENKEKNMLALPVQKLALPSSANSVWHQARQLKITVLSKEIIIKIDTCDNHQIDIDIKRIIYESDIQEEVIDSAANNGAK
jgi:hypothetical protein